MDGNRRYAKQCKLKDGARYEAGFLALVSMVVYCCELGVKYVTAYVLVIDNFKRGPQEVDEYIKDLMLKKIELLCSLDSVVNRYGVRVHVSGNLQLLSEPIRDAANRLMAVTANNPNALLTLCVAYTSTDEITRAVQKSCEEKWVENKRLRCVAVDGGENKTMDIEKHHMAVAPDPDIVIRTSGENRLSN